jgi:hypothetical protein
MNRSTRVNVYLPEETSDLGYKRAECFRSDCIAWDAPRIGRPYCNDQKWRSACANHGYPVTWRGPWFESRPSFTASCIRSSVANGHRSVVQQSGPEVPWPYGLANVCIAAGNLELSAEWKICCYVENVRPWALTENSVELFAVQWLTGDRRVNHHGGKHFQRFL